MKMKYIKQHFTILLLKIIVTSKLFVLKTPSLIKKIKCKLVTINSMFESVRILLVFFSTIVQTFADGWHWCYSKHVSPVCQKSCLLELWLVQFSRVFIHLTIFYLPPSGSVKVKYSTNRYVWLLVNGQKYRWHATPLPPWRCNKSFLKLLATNNKILVK